MSKSLKELVDEISVNCAGKNQSLPAACYHREDFLALEKAKVLNGGWHCLGRADEIPGEGDFFTTTLLNEPMLVVRGGDGGIRVLSNVCRHRAAPVASGYGTASGFRCPYHAWTYEIDGRLRSAPLVEKKLLKNCQLPVIRSECWGGFIFATLDSSIESLQHSLIGLEEQIRNYRMEKMHHVAYFEETWECNWKSLVENFMDGYHLSVVHPQTLRPLTPTRLCQTMESGPAFTGYIANYAKSAPLRKRYSKLLTEDEKRQSKLFCVYPAMVASISPDTLVYLALQPDGPERVRVKWGLSVVEARLSAREKQSRIEKWQAINAEDHALLSSLSQGLQSALYTGGELAPANLEGTVSDFHDYLIAAIRR
ncbi:hypothetical protein AB833_06315 [Chromatiales bacterium (ex Bugula neritina AB1)]|nr:hypothetical protein AB833_06315 [Chromatiales bacterium (ex Bugula neritina AB1)]